MFIHHHNSDGIDLIRTKLTEMWNYKHDEDSKDLFPICAPQIKSTGSKAPYFGTMYFIGLNYWNDKEFQDWLNENHEKLYSIQVFFRGEDDDYMTEVLKYND